MNETHDILCDATYPCDSTDHNYREFDVVKQRWANYNLAWSVGDDKELLKTLLFCTKCGRVIEVVIWRREDTTE